MSKSFDAVVAGGGSNGLTVAAYLAKAGLSVCVVEDQPYVGGGVVTREIAGEGFKHDLASTGHMFIQANPLWINDELGLRSKYGVKYIYTKAMTSVVYPDNSVMKFYKDLDKTCESIAQFSKKDADAYRRFHAWAMQSLDMFIAGMFSPPPPFGVLVSMLEQSEQGQELLRTMMVSGCDIVDEWFESEAVKIALTRFISEGMVDPQLKGTGLNLVMFIGLLHRTGWGIAVGGSGTVSDALVQCIKDNGGTILTSSAVKSFIIAGSECKGVITETGEEILGKKAVVSTLNIKQLPPMIGEDNLPEGFAHKANRLNHSSFSCLNQLLAVNEVPNYKAGLQGDEASYVQFSPSTYEEHLRVFDDYKYGLTHTNDPIAICWTMVDPSRAPAGKHTLYLYHFEPFNLKDGGAAKWDEIKQEKADEVLNFLQSRTTNMGSENIIARWIGSPLDYSRNDRAFVNGDIGHIGMDLHQNLGNRPFVGMGQYRTPIKKFYIAGPSTNPGGGAGLGSRAAVPIIMEDLGMDFSELISKK